MKRHDLIIFMLLFVQIAFLQGCAWTKNLKQEVLIPVQEGKKWGYINEKGSMIIKPQFEDANPFDDSGLACVCLQCEPHRKYSAINRKGRYALASDYEILGEFHEGLAFAYVDGKGGYIDVHGSWIIQPQFAGQIFDFSESLARVRIGDCFGFVGLDGRMKIPAKLKSASDFHEGLAVYAENGKDGYINRDGNIVIKASFDYAHDFSEGLACICKAGKCGFIDKTGKEVIPPKFDEAGNFSEGLVWIVVNNKFGYIAKNGNTVIDPRFASARNFSGGLAAVEVSNEGWGFVDAEGRFVVKPKYEDISDYKEGFLLVTVKNPFHDQVLDRHGNVVWDGPTKHRWGGVMVPPDSAAETNSIWSK